MKLIKVGIYAHYVINYYMVFNDQMFGNPIISKVNFQYETVFENIEEPKINKTKLRGS